MSRYLLDTCAVLWVGQEPSRLSTEATRIITDPANSLLDSAVSAWKIAGKASRGKLQLTKPTLDWWRDIVGALQAEELVLTSEIMIAAMEDTLPHKDPADRMIVATARAAGARLLTADQTLLAHCDLAYW